MHSLTHHKGDTMRLTVRISAFLVFTGGCFASYLLSLPCAYADDTTEPPVAYSIDIDGKPHSIDLGKPTVLKGTFTNPSVTLTAASTRHFNTIGIEFDYPASFTWEADVEVESAQSWTLSGNDFKIMVFQLSKGVTAQSYAQAMVKQFGEEKTTIASTERSLGEKTLSGKVLKTIIAKTEIRMEILEIPSNSKSRLLVLQDSPPEGESMSKEAEATLNVVAKTFAFKLR